MAIFDRKIIFAFLATLIIVFQPLPANAQESISINNEAINPGSFYYSFKRLLEKGMEKFQSIAKCLLKDS